MFFRTRQCMCVHYLGVQKLAKLGGKMVCFWSYWQILERTCTQIKKNVCQNAYLGSIFIPEKYALRVCFESPFTRMISSLKYKCAPPPRIIPKGCFSKKSLSKRSLFRNLQFYINMWLFWRKNCSKQWWTFRISIYLHATWRRAEQAACYRLLLVLLIYV